LDLGAVVLGDGPSLPGVLTVTNVGDRDLSISKISLVGENAGHFAIVGGRCHLGAMVAPSDNCTIQVTVTPTAAGFLNGQLELKDTGGRGSQIAGLHGIGVVPSPSKPVQLATFIYRRPRKLTPRRFATFRFGMPAQEPVRFLCKLDRAAIRPCTSPQTYTHLELGPHVFRVRARTRAPDVSRVFSVARFQIVPRR
jgi:hypothetical protein